MKKLLITVLIVLLVALAGFVIMKGLNINDFTVLSVEQIIEKNDELTVKTSEIKSLLEKDFPAKKEELSGTVTDLLSAKEKYFNLVKTSTEGQISEASTQEVYLVEFLWTKVGNHARREGVNFKMTFSSANTGEQEMHNIAFEVNGHYVAIVEFLYALGDDSELNFKIEDFKMLPSGDNLVATFNVRNIRIENESTS